MFHWSRYKDGSVKWNDGKVRKLVSNCRNTISHDRHMTHIVWNVSLDLYAYNAHAHSFPIPN